MKKLLACALLALVPFASMRMICITPPVAASAPGAAPEAAAVEAAAASADGADGSDCDEFCRMPPDHAAASDPAPAQGTPAVAQGCLVIPDPTCAFVMTVATAVIPAAPALRYSVESSVHDPAARPAYRSPEAATFTPPPEPSSASSL